MTDINGRRVVANFSLSLDGRFNGPGGDYDMSWIVPHAVSQAARNHMVSVTGAATTALLGRKNYQGFSQYWPPVADDEDAAAEERTFAAWLNSVEKVVFSSTIDSSDWNNTRFVASDPAAEVARLREQDGGDIIVLASASIIIELLAADQVDRLSINLCPAIVGGGARLFQDGLPATDWTLTENTGTESGSLCLLFDRVR